MDKVFYKRKQFKGWREPVTIFQKDGQYMLVKQGSVYCRVRSCYLMKKKEISFDYAEKMKRIQKMLPSNVGYQIMILTVKMVMILLIWKVKKMIAVI